MIQEIIDKIEKEIELRKNMPHNHEQVDICYGLNRAKDIVSAMPEPGWIPVTERLPKRPEENPVFENKPLELYLVSVKNADYAFRAFWNGTSFTDGWAKLDVIAWMSLPEPYRPETLREAGAEAGQDTAGQVLQSARKLGFNGRII